MCPPSNKSLPISQVGAGKYEVKKKIGAGCFGDVYRGVVKETGEEVAMKLEKKSCEMPQLKHEADILAKLTGDGPPPQGFTIPLLSSSEGPYNVMVMPMLSRSLEDCCQMSGGTLSVYSSLLICDQVLRRIEYLHSKGLVHRDIKSENFMFGAKERQNIVYLIDFGLTKEWYTAKGHIPFKKGQPLTGTARFASIKVHEGHEQGRRDDLEAIGHMFIYFLRGSVPWSGLSAKTMDEKYKLIMEKKKSVPLAELCDGYPQCFATYLDVTRKLGFAEKPDYKTLRKLFTDEFASQGFEEDFTNFDWYKGKNHQKPEEPPAELPPWTHLEQPDENDPPGAGGNQPCCTVM